MFGNNFIYSNSKPKKRIGFIEKVENKIKPGNRQKKLLPFYFGRISVFVRFNVGIKIQTLKLLHKKISEHEYYSILQTNIHRLAGWHLRTFHLNTISSTQYAFDRNLYHS